MRPVGDGVAGTVAASLVDAVAVRAMIFAAMVGR
jgi:hypothetical protein